jgi:hypothetical protein
MIHRIPPRKRFENLLMTLRHPLFLKEHASLINLPASAAKNVDLLVNLKKRTLFMKSPGERLVIGIHTGKESKHLIIEHVVDKMVQPSR